MLYNSLIVLAPLNIPINRIDSNYTCAIEYTIDPRFIHRTYTRTRTRF